MSDRDHSHPLAPITGDDDARERFDEAAEQARQSRDSEPQHEAAERAGSNPPPE